MGVKNIFTLWLEMLPEVLPLHHQTARDMKKTQYQEILNNLKNGVCEYSNTRTEVSYSLGATKMKVNADGSLTFFSSIEGMARSINKFIKTGY